MWNSASNKLQFKVCQVAHASMAYLDKHSALDPMMVSVVSSIPTGGNFLKFFKPLDVNFSLKCKCDLIVKNSILLLLTTTSLIFLADGGKTKTPRRRTLCHVTVRLPRLTTANPLRRASRIFHPYIMKTKMLHCPRLTLSCDLDLFWCYMVYICGII